MSDTFDFQLSYTEPTTTATADHWELVFAPTEWMPMFVEYRDMDSGIVVVLYSNGTIGIESGTTDIHASFIDRLQSLKALARQHFGEDWGEE